jgi:hypothetical protein
MMTATQTRIVDQEHQRVGEWIDRHGSANWQEGSTCIGCERDGELVAGVMFQQYNGASIYAHIAITGRMTKDWLWFIFYYPFVQLGCHVIIVLIACGNRKARAFVENAGFVLRTMLPDADPSGDVCLYILQKQDCRFLTRRVYG